MLELNVGISDSKEKFQEYIDGTECAFPAVYREEGGNALSKALGNGGVGGPSFLINPDKTFKKSSSYYMEKAAGNIAHECGVSISSSVAHKKSNQIISITGANHKELHLHNENEGIYSIQFLSLKGEVVVEITNQHLHEGTQSIDIENFNLSTGMYLLHLSSTVVQTTEKFIIK